jgi:alpha-mannosidase
MTERRIPMRHRRRNVTTSIRPFAAGLALVLAAAAARLGAAEQASSGAPAATSKVREVVVVFKTHFDIGYTDMASAVVQRYRTSMIDGALDVVDRSRGLPAEQKFAWTIPGWPLSKIAEDWDGQTPERKERIRRTVREGRFVVHALPFTTHTELLEPEDLVRGLGFASALSREAGLQLPRDAKMTDVPCHSWILPTLLRGAGVDFLHLGCNAASSSPRVPALFWWEGPDGSRLLTMYSAAGYGTGLEPPRDWPYRTWLALIHSGDNQGPPIPDEVTKLFEEAARNLPGVTVRIGRLSDFSDRIMAEGADIPVVRGDMPDTWIHGPMCDPVGARIARNVRPEIAAAEALGTLLGAWGVAPPGSPGAIAAAYEKSLLYGEHTWGGAQYWVTKYGAGTKWGYGDAWKADHAAGRFRRLEDSWAEHTAYIEGARDIAEPLLRERLGALARAVGAEGLRVVVFNPLPWARDGMAEVRIQGAPIDALRPAGGGPAVPAAPAGDGTVRFVARDMPAFGYRTYMPVKAEAAEPAWRADPSAAAIESRWFRVVLDPGRGAIRSIVDRRTGRELVDGSSPHGFGRYLHERFDAAQIAAYVKAYVKIDADWAVNELGKPSMPPADKVPYRAASPEGCSVEYEIAADRVAAAMRCGPSAALPHGVTTRVSLPSAGPWVDLEVTVHDMPPDPWPEACWISLPFKVDSPRFLVGRQGSIIDPARDVVPGSNLDLLGVHTGVAVVDPEGRGAGVCSIDTPLVSLGEPGCWKYSREFSPRKAAVYVNLYNNQWTTNFRMWNGGTWSFRVRLWAVERAEAEGAVFTPSLEARVPLLAAAAEGPRGSLPIEGRGLELSRKGVMVTAFGPDPDGGKGTILRLWEVSGTAGSCRVRLPVGVQARSVQPVDLRGRPVGEAIEVEADGSFAAPLKAFAPMTFAIPGGR